MSIEEIKKSLETEIVALNEQERKLGILNNAFKEYYAKDVKSLDSRCEYRIHNLENAHTYSNVAVQEEIENNTKDLVNALNSLSKEINDLETIKKNVNVEFDNETYNSLSKELIGHIDNQLDTSNNVVRKANAILNHDYDLVNEEKAEVKETPVVHKEEEKEITPNEVQTDSLDALVQDLDNELKPVLEDQKVLEEVSNSLENINNEDATLVTNEEDVVAPVLMPEQEKNLQEFLNTVPKSNEEEMQSAASVDEGFVKVEQVLEFGQEEEKAEEQTVDNVVNFPAEAFEENGPVRSRAA